MTNQVTDGLGARVREARLAAGMSQSAFAVALYLGSQSAISLWENGERQIALDELINIARVTNRPLSFFLGDLVTGLHASNDETATVLRALEAHPEWVAEVHNFIDYLEWKCAS